MSEPEQTFTITRTWLHQHKSANGGWTTPQLIAIGAEWPPQHGWQIGVIGTQISDTSRKIFEHQCSVSPVERDAEVDAHIDNEVFQQQLVAVADYYSAQIRAAQAVINDLQPKLDTLRFLDPPSLDLEYLGVFMGTR